MILLFLLSSKVLGENVGMGIKKKWRLSDWRRAAYWILLFRWWNEGLFILCWFPQSALSFRHWSFASFGISTMQQLHQWRLLCHHHRTQTTCLYRHLWQWDESLFLLITICSWLLWLSTLVQCHTVYMVLRLRRTMSVNCWSYSIKIYVLFGISINHKT